MRFVNSSYEIIDQEPNVLGIYKQIEKAARTSYKSEDRITDGSAQKMVDALIKNKHYACLEHGTVYLRIPVEDDVDGIYFDRYFFNPYSCLVDEDNDGFCDYLCVTTNARVLVENGWLDDLKYLCEPTEYHEKRISVKFTTSIGVGREMIRHRAFSFMQESTRYCNYSKNKFDNQLTFIIPQWIYDCRTEVSKHVDSLTGDTMGWILSEEGENLIEHLTVHDRTVSSWYDLLQRIEEDYVYYITTDEGQWPIRLLLQERTTSTRLPFSLVSLLPCRPSTPSV